ncbi:MAG: hypothetical protein LBV23_08905 [Deltaproteobacteria bacterium]|jgi:hypothetical protein|nr:hypothetical protein [Deltaproteobacteria bacterium]
MNSTSLALSAKAAPLPAQSSRAAWREEMLGQFLDNMRRQKQTDIVVEAEPKINLNIKGQFLDVYV